MSRRITWVLALVVALVIAAGAALLLSAKPQLDDARHRVDDRFDAVRAQLVARYERLASLQQALAGVGSADRSVTRDLGDELTRWHDLVSARHPDPEREVGIANSLEALATRARVNVAASARLQSSAEIAAAFQAFDAASVSPPAVRAYNRAVQAYEASRHVMWHRPAVELLGFSSRPRLTIAPHA